MEQEINLFFYLTYFLNKYLDQFFAIGGQQNNSKSIDVEFLVTVSTQQKAAIGK